MRKLFFFVSEKEHVFNILLDFVAIKYTAVMLFIAIMQRWNLIVEKKTKTILSNSIYSCAQKRCEYNNLENTMEICKL